MKAECEVYLLEFKNPFSSCKEGFYIIGLALSLQGRRVLSGAYPNFLRSLAAQFF